jgi:hypothetical protein
MRVYAKYKLLKDLPELKAGTILHWDLWQERYTELSYIPRNVKTKLSYDNEFIVNHKEWFEPIGEARELYEAFPEDFTEEHFYFGELRHNKMCRFCYDAHSILDSKEFQNQVTEIFKNMYEKKIKLLTINNQQ